MLQPYPPHEDSYSNAVWGDFCTINTGDQTYAVWGRCLAKRVVQLTWKFGQVPPLFAIANSSASGEFVMWFLYHGFLWYRFIPPDLK